jgi:hypothetical protein
LFSIWIAQLENDSKVGRDIKKSTVAKFTNKEPGTVLGKWARLM